MYKRLRFLFLSLLLGVTFSLSPLFQNYVNVKAYETTSFTPTQKFLDKMITEVKKYFTIIDDGTMQNYTLFYDKVRQNWVFMYGQYATHIVRRYNNQMADDILFQLKVGEGSLLMYFNRNFDIVSQRVLKTQNVDLGSENQLQIALNTSVTEGFTFYRSDKRLFDTFMKHAKKGPDSSGGTVVVPPPDNSITSEDKSFFNSQFEGVKNTITPPLNDLKDETKAVKEEVKKTGGIFGAAIDGLKNALLSPLNLIKKAIDGVVESIKGFFIPNSNDLKSIFDKFNNFFIQKLGAIYQSFKFFTDFVTSLASAGKNFFVSMPRIDLYGTTIGFDLDFRLINQAPFKSLYEIYYRFFELSLVIGFINFLMKQRDSFFKE